MTASSYPSDTAYGVQEITPMTASSYPSGTYRIAHASVMLNNDAAVADVSYQSAPGPNNQAPKTFTGTGASKRERGDSPDPVTGEILAAARAYGELSARLHREARSRVRAQDAEKKQRENRLKKKKVKALRGVLSDDDSDAGVPDSVPFREPDGGCGCGCGTCYDGQ